MTGSSHDLPQGVAVTRFVAGTAAVVVLSGLATLAIWAIAYPAVRGWSATAVTSGSMSPAISVGDVLVTGPVEADRLEPGAVIVFDNEAGRGLVTHRLVEMLPTGEYLTQGDANKSADSTPVQPDQVQGIGRLVVPLVGRPQAWAATGDFGSLALAAVGLVALIGAARWGLLAEFDPWAEPKPVPAPRQTHRAGPVVATGVALLVLAAAPVGNRSATAAYADPAQSDASSITAAGSFP